MKRIAEEVSRELGRFGPAAGMVRIVEVWVDAVGRTIARNAWPARIARNGTLHVATSSSSWAFELQQLEGDVLRRLRAAAGTAAPSSVRFAVGKLPELGPEDADEKRARAPRRPSEDELVRGVSIAASIDDPELRKVVAKAAAQSLSEAGSDHVF